MRQPMNQFKIKNKKYISKEFVVAKKYSTFDPEISKQRVSIMISISIFRQFTQSKSFAKYKDARMVEW